MRSQPGDWWFPIHDSEPVERRQLLDRAAQGDRQAVAILKARYRLLYWGKNDRTLLI